MNAKIRLLSLLSALFCFQNMGWSQGFELDAENDTTALLNITVYQPNDKAYQGPLRFLGLRHGREYEAKTNANGQALGIPLHINDEYLIYCGETLASQRANIQNIPFGEYGIEAYSQRTLRIKFIYTDLQKKALANEPIVARSLYTGLEYQANTDAKGTALFYLPLEGEYAFAAKHRGDVSSYQVKAPDNDQERQTIRFSWIGSKAYEAKLAAAKAEEDAHQAEIEAHRNEVETGISKLDKAKTSKDVEQLDFHLDFQRYPLTFLQKNYPKKAEAWYALQKNNEQLFIKERPLLAALERIKAKFPKLALATHTAQHGGTRYLEDLLLFYSKCKGQNTKLIVQGHNKAGKHIDAFFKEALELNAMLKELQELTKEQSYNYRTVLGFIAQAQQQTGEHELIFVANNFVSPEDMQALSKVNKPLRIILGNFGDLQPGEARKNRLVCDMGKMRFSDLNTTWLDLAYKTKGSVHTGRIDLWDIHKTPEGKVLELNGEQYQLRNGKFVNLTIATNKR